MSMFHDLRRSYFSFRQNAGGVALAGPRLTGPNGQRLGYVEKIAFTPTKVKIEGWADADRVTLSTEAKGEIAVAVPCIHRRDVQTALRSAKGSYGFSINISPMSEPIKLNVYREGIQAVVRLPKPSLFSRLKGEIDLNRRYVRVLISVAPDVVSWVRHRDPHARRRVGAIFRASGSSMIELDMRALAADPWPKASDTPITIVMPVYQGLHLLDQVIGRVRDNTDLPWHLVVIEDASPDPQVLARLRKWQDILTPERMTLVANTTNLGFVGSANLGLGIARERGCHVVLLNSDALVPFGWASRLIAPILNNRRVASVTPFSNDAEIANVPIPGKPMALLPGEGDAIDRLACDHANSGSVADVPTGVGFCMAMNIRALRDLPDFDPIFGKGYGEEVDWCQKVAALGWRNLLTAGVFVEHHGGQSFGPDAKQSLTQQNGALISRRYPRFDEQVQTFLGKDPLLSRRLMLGVFLAAHRAHAANRKLAVFLGHGMGGGAETYLRQRIAKEIASYGHAVVIRTMPDTSWHIELHTGRGKISGMVDKAKALMPFFQNLTGLHIVYSCGVGTAKPRDIPRALNFLARRPDSTLEVAFNDFFPISPSYTLLDSHDAFGGFPLDPGNSAHQFLESDGSVIELAEWKRVWGDMIGRAEQLTTFSPSSSAIVAAAWPDHESRIVLQPHSLTSPVPVLRPRRTGPVIGVLGNISRAKGADVLARLSRAMATCRQGRIVLIGNIEPGYVLTKPSIVLGSYHLKDMAPIADRHGITDWFFPSIWPETFSYAVHEMIATKLPVWTFDIGGQADAVRAALEKGQPGGLIPLEMGQFDLMGLVKTLTGDRTPQTREVAYVA